MPSNKDLPIWYHPNTPRILTQFECHSCNKKGFVLCEDNRSRFCGFCGATQFADQDVPLTSVEEGALKSLIRNGFRVKEFIPSERLLVKPREEPKGRLDWLFGKSKAAETDTEQAPAEVWQRRTEFYLPSVHNDAHVTVTSKTLKERDGFLVKREHEAWDDSHGTFIRTDFPQAIAETAKHLARLLKIAEICITPDSSQEQHICFERRQKAAMLNGFPPWRLTRVVRVRLRWWD